ncbi:MAG: arginine deiminase family protein, partial [Spirochaetaceae bacterium]|nr:arginine deiminase family protein [Spirochaetaceae bacterium]
ESLISQIHGEFNYYFPPLTNLYFTRDPGTVIGGAVSINTMATMARRGESLLLKYIMEEIQQETHKKIDHLFGYNQSQSLEGGDIFILNPETVLIGCSARSSTTAIEQLSRELFKTNMKIKKIIVLQIPFHRAFMHLDTVFTMVDYDKFTIYWGIKDQLKIFELSRDKENRLSITSSTDLKEVLRRNLRIPSVLLIKSGGNNSVNASREQWNDSTNTLAIAPGRVITYNRNQITNEALYKAGIEVIPIEGSELVRGRGGPRCMSMPLKRKPWRYSHG